MADTGTTTPTANQDEEFRMLLGFLQGQRDAVLRTVEGLPEEAWQQPVVASGWTVAGMLWHLGGAEYHWFQDVTTGPQGEPPGDAEEGEYDWNAAFTCDLPSAEIIANYQAVCQRSDEVLAVTPLSAVPRGTHNDPAVDVPNVRWIVLHMIEETATHSGHLEIARELLDGKTRLAGR